MPIDATFEETGSVAMSNEKVSKYLEGKNIRNKIFVPNKIYNFVVTENRQ